MARTEQTKAPELPSPHPDFTVYTDGPFPTVYLLRPLSEAAKEWARDHLPLDAQMLGDAIAVEHRYIGAIVEGIQKDGLTVGEDV